MAPRRGAGFGIPLEDEPLTSGEAVEQIIGEVAGNMEPVAKCYRRIPGQDRDYVGQLTVTAGMMLEEEIASHWGGGTYTVQFWAKGEDETRRTPKGSVTVRIAGQPRAPEWEKDKAAPVAAVSVVPAAIEAQLAEMRVANARLEGKLEGLAMANGAKAGAVDPVAMFRDFAQILKTTSPTAAPQDPMAAITSIMGAVEKVVGVGRDLAPEREAGGTNWAPVVDRTVDAIKLLVEENRAQRGAPALGPGTPDVPAKTFPEGTPMWQVEIAQWIPKLLVRAEGDKDAQLAATVFLEDVTPATGRAVVEQALGATFVADTLKQLALIEPRTTQHAEWFTDFLTQIQDYAKDAAAQGTGGATPAVKLEP